VKRGILGGSQATVSVHEQEHRWAPPWTLVIHTDGLSSRWDWPDFPRLEHETPQVSASRLLRSLASDDDDATVLVVKGRSS
jgi:hypothetical protein